MPYDPERHHRRSIRLQGYDYSQPGAYFVTICTHGRECLFGEIVDGEMRLNELGEMVAYTWHDLVNHVDGIMLDEYVIMPNHMHGVIIIVGTDDVDVGAGSEPAPTSTEPAPTSTKPAPTSTKPVPTSTKPAPTSTEPAPTSTKPAPTDATNRPKKRHPLPEIVRQLKTFSARRINALRNTPGVPVWQRNYYEHIIRNEAELQRIRQYIRQNPERWAEDSENMPPSSTREVKP